MIRWVFLFLLLANAISLFWFSQQEGSANKSVTPVESQVQQIRLISEMPEGSLKLRKADSGSVENDAEDFWCASLEGLDNRKSAAALRASLLKRGVFAELQQLREESVYGYEVTVMVPDKLDARLYLLDYLDKSAVVPVEKEPEPGMRLLVGQYENEVQSQEVMGELSDQGLIVSVEPLSRIVQRYGVVIQARVDRNLSNEIKVLVENNYSGVKIGKKVCEGVARLGRTE